MWRKGWEYRGRLSNTCNIILCSYVSRKSQSLGASASYDGIFKHGGSGAFMYGLAIIRDT